MGAVWGEGGLRGSLGDEIRIHLKTRGVSKQQLPLRFNCAGGGEGGEGGKEVRRLKG